ncbi:MAG: hypothetical protein IJY24_03195 [Clostridia bacterium]|nr:hypothetical protein [Clostridia bacterium]
MNRYIELMARTLDAYSDGDIIEYTERVEREGLTEHGFPRLAVNLGILISHGYRVGLLPLFIRMMDLCCREIPRVRAANNFSVKEIILCILELERTELVPRERIMLWRSQLSSIDRWQAYELVVRSREETAFNWVLFASVSEHLRGLVGLCDDEGEFIETQLATQMRLLDENGMYRDDLFLATIVYDYVSRGLFAQLLAFGYRGEFARRMDESLMRAGLLSLESLSALGEIPYGGRSNQFLHNEATALITLEYERRRYEGLGDIERRDAFAASIDRVLSSLEGWLSREPLSHIKNGFNPRGGYGCEEYAYFDKYMITTASSLYAAYMISYLDNVIIEDCAFPQAEYKGEARTYVASLSNHFGQTVLKAGDYTAQVSHRAKTGYDAIGLGRLHRRGAPSEICLSVPCPPKPTYSIGGAEPLPLSLIGLSALDRSALECEECNLLESMVSGDIAEVSLFANQVTTTYRLSPEGLSVTVHGEGELCLYLPMLEECGLGEPFLEIGTNKALLQYRSWQLEYLTNGEIFDTGSLSYNRNGVYRRLLVRGRSGLAVDIKITKM